MIDILQSNIEIENKPDRSAKFRYQYVAKSWIKEDKIE